MPNLSWRKPPIKGPRKNPRLWQPKRCPYRNQDQDRWKTSTSMAKPTTQVAAPAIPWRKLSEKTEIKVPEQKWTSKLMQLKAVAQVTLEFFVFYIDRISYRKWAWRSVDLLHIQQEVMLEQYTCCPEESTILLSDFFYYGHYNTINNHISEYGKAGYNQNHHFWFTILVEHG